MTEAGKQESKHVGAGQTPMCESWKILTLPWLFGCALRYGSEKGRFPCWCVLMRLELVGPATACLPVDLERRDYLLQLLSSLLLPPNATFIKGTGDIGFVSPSSHIIRLFWCQGGSKKAPTQSRTQARSVAVKEA